VNLELITVGDELLLGFTIDTNAAYLARQLAPLGVRIVRRSTVGDEAEAIADAVDQALRRTGAVITSGGLGPTADDLTKPAIAKLFGRELVFHDDLWERLRERWRGFGRSGEPPEANRQQVMIPRGATVLENRHGSAPGVWLEDDGGRWVAMLPGVPRELRGMLADVLIPRIQERLGGVTAVVRSRTLRTTGVAESALPSLLGDAAGGIPPLGLAYLPGQEGVDLRLTVAGLAADAAEAALEAGILKLRERVGRYVYGEGTDDLAGVVLELARGRRLSIAVAESCTGGLLGARLTSIPGSSDVMRGGVIAYADEVKVGLLGVDPATLAAHGAVSEETARQMAAGARARAGGDIGIGITGVAGPSGGTPEKPVGTVWLAVDIGGAATALKGRFIGDREEIRFRATQSALDMVRRALQA
jgi:competence/damage-inducible protein CinA-like protein